MDSVGESPSVGILDHNVSIQWRQVCGRLESLLTMLVSNGGSVCGTLCALAVAGHVGTVL